MRSEYYREHFEWDKEAQTEFKVSFAPVRAGAVYSQYRRHAPAEHTAYHDSRWWRGWLCSTATTSGSWPTRPAARRTNAIRRSPSAPCARGSRYVAVDVGRQAVHLGTEPAYPGPCPEYRQYCTRCKALGSLAVQVYDQRERA